MSVSVRRDGLSGHSLPFRFPLSSTSQFSVSRTLVFGPFCPSPLRIGGRSLGKLRPNVHQGLQTQGSRPLKPPV